MANYFTIVSFCGGGIRGLLSATILNRIATEYPSILTGTSLFAGTSTGAGIVSQLLAKQTPTQIIDNYLNVDVPFYQKQQTSPSAPAYDIESLYLSQVRLHGGDPLLSQFDQSVLLTAFNLDAKPGWTPVLYTNMAQGCGITADAGVATAVTQSAAMPGMFAPYKNVVDGGFVNHDPTLCAISLALRNGIAIEDIVVLDLGTGLYSRPMQPDTSGWGASQWQVGDGNGDDPPALLVNGSTSPVLSITLNGMTTQLVPYLARMMLEPRFVSVNPGISFIPENAWQPDQLTLLQFVGTNANISTALELVGTYWPSGT